MKYFAVLALAFLAICIQDSSAQSHNITWGNINAYDQLLSREIVVKKYKLMQIITEDVKFPQAGQYNYRQITGIRVIDQYTNGDGGHATLYAGGVGHESVTIHLKSERNHGFNFIIEIYGR